MRFRAWLGAAIGALLVALSLSTFLLASKSAPGESITGAPTQKGKTMPVALEITLGEKGDEVVRRSGLKIKRSQVSTALLYDASPDRTGVAQEVVVKTASHSVSLPLSDSILFYDDTVDPYGVEQIDLNLKLPKPPKDATQIAELETYDRAIYTLVTDVIARINKAGWKRYIDPSEPRVAGKATYRLSGNRAAYRPKISQASDPLVTLTFTEWKTLEENKTHSWQWFADGVFINFGYTKDARNAASTVIDDARITIESERLIMSRSDPKGEGNVERGIDVYRSSIAASLAIREREETKSRAAGLKILEDWIDPPIGNVAVSHK